MRIAADNHHALRCRGHLCRTGAHQRRRPGMTETPMTAGMLNTPAMREGAGGQYPLGRLQTADQVADVMAWLLGDGAARLTGQVIVVDGGFTTVRPLVK